MYLLIYFLCVSCNIHILTSVDHIESWYCYQMCYKIILCTPLTDMAESKRINKWKRMYVADRYPTKLPSRFIVYTNC